MPVPRWLSQNATAFVMGALGFAAGMYATIASVALYDLERRMELRELLETHVLWHATVLDDEVEGLCEHVYRMYKRDGTGDLVECRELLHPRFTR